MLPDTPDGDALIHIATIYAVAAKYMIAKLNDKSYWEFLRLVGRAALPSRDLTIIYFRSLSQLLRFVDFSSIGMSGMVSREWSFSSDQEELF